MAYSLADGNSTSSLTALVNSTQIPSDSIRTGLQIFVKNANRYILPVIIAIGVLGNVISFLVFLITALKKISTSVYLAALALSDTGFLLCVWIVWFDNMDMHFFHTNGVCQIVVYLTFVFSFTSVWFVNAFTMEMYISVFHPSKAAKVCRPVYARIVVVCISTFAGIFYAFSLWAANVVKYKGGQKCLFMQNAETTMILSILDTFLTLLIPFLMIIFMITRLLVDVSSLYKRQSSSRECGNGNSRTDAGTDSMATEEPSNSESPTRNQSNEAQGNRAQSKLKQMLLVVVMVFLVMNLPSHAIRVQSFVRSLVDHTYRTDATEALWQQLFQILYYLNFGVNFILYSLCAKSFRVCLMRLPSELCQSNCRCIRVKWTRLFSVFTKSKDVDENERRALEHSRLVDIHLSAMHLSQIPSFDSEYVCKSPPCLLSPDSTAV
ncbi:thyrotropin-releasing hormone receptor-like [Saccostrea echinata]|uniref:thyrotropin-releasing hormone receptor-like n=1 Tax=Saccostrea echinata TaxID=191078 RepID=UPI002A80EE99|nr:thyrotropin-releasing hormone receptor-like [Saccostrea echinata]